MKGRNAGVPNMRVLQTKNVWRSFDSGKGVKQGKKHKPPLGVLGRE